MTSLVLATDVEGVFTSRALAKAGQWLSPSLLISAAVILVLLWWTTPGADIRWATFWLAVIGVGVVTALRTDRVWLGVLSIVIASGGGAYFYAVTLSMQLGPGTASDNLLLSLTKIAAVIAGVGGRSLRTCIVLCTLGFGLTGASSIVAARHTGMVVAFDVTAFASYIAVIGMLLVLWRARSGAAKGASDMNSAGLAEERLSEEARIISHASSVLHDTVLNDLQALALAPSGPLTHAHTDMIERDLELLSGNRELLLAPRNSAIAQQRAKRAEANPLASVISRSQARGTRVIFSGDPAEFAKLPASAEQAVVAAVDQCLVNVSRHSGVDEAEVTIGGTEREVSVMITDAGRGFDTNTTDPARLGLRLSVRDRIGAAGGSVQLWSSPGAGTAILLAVPTATVFAEEN